MVDEFTLQAISGITDPDQVRITLYINRQQVHVPLVDAVVIAADGTYLPLAGGTLTGLLTTNGQVAFPATQNPSADVNTLDDYEENPWTPVLAFGGASVGITYNNRQGRYQKVGNKVTIWGNVNLSSKGTSVGNATITGLPFPAVSNLNIYSGAVGFFSNTATVVSMGCGVLAASSAVTLYNLPSNTLTNANFNNNTQVVFHVEYEA